MVGWVWMNQDDVPIRILGSSYLRQTSTII